MLKKIKYNFWLLIFNFGFKVVKLMVKRFPNIPNWEKVYFSLLRDWIDLNALKMKGWENVKED